MTMERVVLAAMWVFIAIAAYRYLRSPLKREAILVFLACQVFSWSLSHLLVQHGGILNPVREFPYASSCLFTTNYAFYPAGNVIYSLHYPQRKGRFSKVGYTFMHVFGLTALFTAMEHYTNLMDFGWFTWYYFGILNLIVYWSVHRFRIWYFGRSFAHGVEH